MMINKYIAVIENEYDDGLYGTTVIEYLPFQSRYTKDEIEQGYDQNIGKYPFKPFQILDTGIRITKYNQLQEVCTIQEWFTQYGVGVKETRDDVDKKISLQYTNK